MCYKYGITFRTLYLNTGVWYQTLTVLLVSAASCNAILNFFIYSTRHRDIRIGVKYLFMCKVRITLCNS